MAAWKEMGESFKSLLRLRTEPVAFRWLEKAEQLEKIPNVVRVRSGFTLWDRFRPFPGGRFLGVEQNAGRTARIQVPDSPDNGRGGNPRSRP